MEITFIGTKEALIGWNNSEFTADQRQILLTLNILRKSVKEVYQETVESIAYAKSLIAGLSQAVNQEAMCLSQVALTGDAGDLYEFFSGYDQCTGKKLTNMGRMLSGIGIIIGSGKIYCSVVEHAGIGKAVYKKIEDVYDSAKKIGMSKPSDVKAWARAMADVSESRLTKIVAESKRIVPSATPQKIDPNVIKFSQSLVYSPKVVEITDSMKKHGWLNKKDFDVVKMTDGTLISVDNKRLLAASRAGVDVKDTVRSSNEKLSSEMAKLFTTKEGIPTTWEEAIRFRMNNQKKLYRETYPNGSYVTGSPQ